MTHISYLTRKTLQLFSIVIIVVILGFSSCKKSEFLDAKPNSNIVVPNTIEAFQALLDNAGQSVGDGKFNNVFGQSPSLGEESSDDFYLTTASWQSQSDIADRNAYIWAKDIYQGDVSGQDWNAPYQQVFYSNVVLDNLHYVIPTPANQSQISSIMGTALFFRAFAFYNLVSEFSPPYDNATANTDMGIVLKLSSDININPGRASVQNTYNQVISDAKKSLKLLSVAVNFNNPNRPSKPAAYAFLARVYLSMRSYDNAKLYADSSLQLYNKLLDYNAVPSYSFPFDYPSDASNPESIYQSWLMPNESMIWGGGYGDGNADTTLYKSYSDNDLRKSIYFVKASGIVKYGWSYSGDIYGFGGLATDEMFLIRAEGFARDGDTQSAMSDLNTLLSKRYKTGSFVPLTAASSSDALNLILQERRKELIFRGLRWTDLRRLNKEGANITLTRVINGNTYTLVPNSPLYVFPIPPNEVNSTGIVQNLR